MAKKRIIILGAGLSGLSAAWHLQKKGVECLVLEKEKEAGGLCRSKKVNGFTFDYSGHLLHFRHDYTFNMVKNILGCDLVEHRRSARIYLCGVYSQYPFQANLYGLPPAIIKDCLLGFISASRNKSSGKEKLTFLDWINETFGIGIAKYFMVPYNTKFWTVSPNKMTCEWLDGFIPVPSLGQLVDGTIKISRRQFGYNAHFWYPKKGGIFEVVSALTKEVRNIHTDCQVMDIDNNEIKLTSGVRERFDYLISTIPLPEMANLIKVLPAGISASFKKLRWNSILNINLGIGRNDSLKQHWIYFPQKELSFFRVGFPHSFSSSAVPPGKSSLYVEVSYSRSKPLDKKNIVERIIRELKTTGIFGQDEKIFVHDINDIKYGYPIYDVNYAVARKAILEYFAGRNIITCGRYGSWRYMSMEDCILNSYKIAEAL